MNLVGVPVCSTLDGIAIHHYLGSDTCVCGEKTWPADLDEDDES